MGDLRKSRDTHAQEENEVNEAIQLHMDRAKARYACQNQTGAILSMRKVKTLQAQQAQLIQVLKFLSIREIDLVKYTNKAKEFAAAAATAKQQDDADDQVHSSMEIELETLLNVELEVQEMLTTKTTKV